MGQRAKPGTRPVTGIVLVDKPGGLTSNRVLQRVRRLYGAEKAGHTGTLDPMATGMLPVCLGAATRVSGLMLNANKRYRVRAEFGVATDSGDATGRITDRRDVGWPGWAALDDALSALRGRIRQVPPMYSAVRHQGRRLYELARQGQDVPRAAREIEIFELAVETAEWPVLSLSVHCSKGTYVRTLVTDLAAALDTVAHVTALRRLQVGPFMENQMVSLAELEAAADAGIESLDRWLLGIDCALVDMPSITVTAADGRALRQGRRVVVAAAEPRAPLRIYDDGGHFVGLGELTASGELRPARIFPA